MTSVVYLSPFFFHSAICNQLWLKMQIKVDFWFIPIFFIEYSLIQLFERQFKDKHCSFWLWCCVECLILSRNNSMFVTRFESRCLSRICKIEQGRQIRKAHDCARLSNFCFMNKLIISN